MTVEYFDFDQGSDEWFAVRAGKATASEFSRLITSTGKPSTQISGYAATLAAELYAGKPLESWEGNQWATRGADLEPLARSAYEYIHEVEVRQVGFAPRGDYGCSPDGLVGDGGMLEIKCLAPWKHVAAFGYIKQKGKPPPDYIAQAQGQLLVCDRQWVDLMFYHPELPYAILRVERSESYHQALVEQLAACLRERDSLVAMLWGVNDGD